MIFNSTWFNALSSSLSARYPTCFHIINISHIGLHSNTYVNEVDNLEGEVYHLIIHLLSECLLCAKYPVVYEDTIVIKINIFCSHGAWNLKLRKGNKIITYIKLILCFLSREDTQYWTIDKSWYHIKEVREGPLATEDAMLELRFEGSLGIS